MARKPKKHLPEDMALWEQVKKSVKPLPKKRLPEPQTPKPQKMEELLAQEEAPLSPPHAARSKKPRPSLPSYQPPAPPSSAVPPLATIEPKIKRSLRRGRDGIEARLDLHGFREVEAHDRLHAFLRDSQMSGKKLVLVITGKGKSNGEGVLKRAVPRWLSEPAMRSVVIGFEGAALHHGGSGALYVRLRKRG